MIGAIARYEFRRQRAGRVFLVVAAVSLLMVLGSVGVDALRVGVGDGGLRNGAEVIVRTHGVWTLFYLFTAAAFAGEAALRDDAAGFAPVVRASPAKGRDLALGRYLGAFVATVLCFLTVPLAFALAPFMPWVAPETVGPLRADALLFSTIFIALPNLFLGTALFFALAAGTRAMGAVLLGAVALITLYGLGGRSGAALSPLLEPFGLAAYRTAIAGWPAAARDAAVPWGDPILLANRALAVALGVAALALAVRLYRAAPRGKARPVGIDPTPAPDARYRPLRPSPMPGAQARARLGLELKQVLRSPIFLALFGMALAGGIARLGGLAPGLDDRALLLAVHDAFALAPLVTILFFAGELVWNERDRGMHGLIGACPISRPVLILPKLAALLAVLAALALAVVGAAVATHGPDRLPAVAGLAASAWYEWALTAVLATTLQLLAPGKLAGWGLFVLFLIGSLALERLGVHDPLVRYARHPGWPLPGGPDAWLYRLYWTAIAAGLFAIALRFHARPRRSPTNA